MMIDGSTSSASSSSQPRSLQLNAFKAGMEGLDTEKINAIIREASRGSNYYQHQKKRQEQIDEKIRAMTKKLNSLTPTEIEESTRKMDELGREMEKSRNLSRIIVHVDMDAFYAAVETRDNPSFKDKPMAVGCQSMLSTSNYIARRFGVRAAMPGFIALKLCPELQIVPPNFKKYREVSSQVQEIFSKYDPDFSAMSLDEAYLDITDYVTDRMNSEDCEETADELASRIVEEMRFKIFEKTQLTASAGIAANARLAKVCSDQNKPNGQFQIPRTKEAIMEFVDKLLVRKIGGVGNVTEQLLNSIGVTTCKNLWEKRGLLNLLFSSTACHCFIRIALGLGSVDIKWDSPRKSMSVERTFNDTHDISILNQWCQELSEDLGNDLHEEQLVGKTVTLKLKTSEFVVKTRSLTLGHATSDSKQIFSVAKKLLSREMNTSASDGITLKLRLMGVRMSSLTNKEDNAFDTKKQCTLEELFTKGLKTENSSLQTEETGQFSCPLCNKIGGKTVKELNSHVKKCVGADDGRVKVENEILSTFSTCENELQAQPDIPSAVGCISDLQPEMLPANVEFCSNFENETITTDENFHLKNNLNGSLEFTCPVCEITQMWKTLAGFNQHVDVCLNRKAIKNMLQSETSNAERKTCSKSNGKRKRTDYNGSMEKFLLVTKK